MLKRPLDRIELKQEDKKELFIPRHTAKTGERRRMHASSYAPTQSSAAAVTQEVEVKLKLMTKEDHAKVKVLFAEHHSGRYHQENWFFDGGEKELTSNLNILRIRFYNKDEKAIVTVKARASLQDGIGRAMEEEEAVDVSEARRCLDDPNRILELPSDLIQRKKTHFGLKTMTGLGGFENIRDEYTWEGYKLELDETIYDFGINYEIECETNDPETLRDRLEHLFKEREIHYQYRTSTKFACFMKRTLEDG